MKWLKHHIWAVVRLIKIYSSNPVVKWICWLLLDIVLHFQGGSVVRPAQRQKSVITSADKKNPTSPVHRRTRRSRPRLLHKLLSFLCLFATALHTPLPLKWHLEFIRIWNNTKKLRPRMYVGTRMRDTRAGLHRSLPHLSLFLSFWSYYSWSRWQQIKFPARARKNRRPELNWKQLEWGLWIEKGRKRKRPGVQLRCLQPHGFLAGASQLHYFAPWTSCIQSFFLTSDFRETQ